MPVESKTTNITIIPSFELYEWFLIDIVSENIQKYLSLIRPILD